MPATVRYFTPEEANALLPRLRREIRELGEQVRRARTLSGTAGDLDSRERADARTELERLEHEAQAVLDRIRGEGVHVKGIEPALLDFPALRNGQEAYLCWREGEEDVAFWHPLHTGFAGRLPLEPDGAVWEWFN